MKTSRHSAHHACTALAVVEVDSIAVGIAAFDRLIKQAPVALLKAGTVSRGRYLILVGGTVASVEEAHREAVTAAGSWLSDEVLLADVHPSLAATIFGASQVPRHEALGVIETRSVPCLLRGADAALKSTTVRLSRLRLADGMGGKSYLLLDGEIAEVDAACEIACARIPAEYLLACRVLPRLDEATRDLLSGDGRFASCEALEPEGAEQVEKSETVAMVGNPDRPDKPPWETP